MEEKVTYRVDKDNRIFQVITQTSVTEIELTEEEYVRQVNQASTMLKNAQAALDTFRAFVATLVPDKEIEPTEVKVQTVTEPIVNQEVLEEVIKIEE